MAEEDCDEWGVNGIAEQESALERLGRIPLVEVPDSDLNPTKTRIKELLRCPIDWDHVAPADCAVVQDFEYYWKVVATECLKRPTGDLGTFNAPEEFEVPIPQLTESQEMNRDPFKDLPDSERECLRRDLKKYAEEVEGETFEILFSPFFLSLENETDLKDDLPQIEAWLKRSKSKYIEKMRRFEKMRVATDREYSKHFPVPNQKAAKTREKSRNGRSYFYKGVTPEQLMRLWWEILWSCWSSLLDVATANLYVDAGTTIGASFGKDTRYLLFNVDLSTPQFHAYPLPEKHVPKKAGSPILAKALVGIIRMD